jgi:hypothetical protein
MEGPDIILKMNFWTEYNVVLGEMKGSSILFNMNFWAEYSIGLGRERVVYSP